MSSVTDSLGALGFEDTDALAGLIEAETVHHDSREMDVTDIVDVERDDALCRLKRSAMDVYGQVEKQQEGR